MRKKSLKVNGVGVNDAPYSVQLFETVGFTSEGKRIQKLTWLCPYYEKWKQMIRRCYSEKYQKGHPTYIGCSVVPEWHYFMTFRAWMEKQDWEGKQLDKDILCHGNKVYGPDTCVFVDANVNSFMTDRASARGDWPIGVSFHKHVKKFQARCHSVLEDKEILLGYFQNPQHAHQAWLTFKLEQAKILASQQPDPRIAKALVERYENYEIVNGKS